MATAGAIIDVKNGKLSLTVGDENCLVRGELADVKNDESREYAHFLEAQPYIHPHKALIE